MEIYANILASATIFVFSICNVVNQNNIKEVDTKKRIITLTNGEICLISSRMLKGMFL